jgi:hypothetical protein
MHQLIIHDGVRDEQTAQREDGEISEEPPEGIRNRRKGPFLKYRIIGKEIASKKDKAAYP